MATMSWHNWSLCSEAKIERSVGLELSTDLKANPSASSSGFLSESRLLQLGLSSHCLEVYHLESSWMPSGHRDSA